MVETKAVLSIEWVTFKFSLAYIMYIQFLLNKYNYFEGKDRKSLHAFTVVA